VSDYQVFLASKSVDAPACGLTRIPKLNPSLFPFQADIVRWALRRGRAAVFADTGLGKGWIALEWLRCVAKHTKRPALLLAPLAVSHQFAREAAKIGVEARVVSDASEVGPGINVTNYHKLPRFDASAFGAVAIDESSILKDYSAATRNALIQTFAATPFKLALTATPSPNDHTELGNHAEFLGVMTRAEMLSMFFVHDMDQTQDWRLKGHAQTRFWEWVASWAVALRRPSDLGYPDDAYALPPLRHHQHTIKADQAQA
jgi:superfamily II DNA or RNA helicase